MSSWNRDRAVICLQNQHQRDTNHQCCRCHSILDSTQRHIYLRNTENYPCLRKQSLQPILHVLSIVAKNKTVHLRSIQPLPKMLSILVQISHSVVLALIYMIHLQTEPVDCCRQVFIQPQLNFTRSEDC